MHIRYYHYIPNVPISVAARSKAWDCGRSSAGIAGSNFTGRMDIRLYECCVSSGRGPCDGPIPLPAESYRVLGV